MKDELEDFIRLNRQAFDDKEPRDVWQKIQPSLPGRTRSLWNSVGLWRAAAVLFMLTTGYFLVSVTSARRDDRQEQLASAVTFNEFADVEAFYTDQIIEKVKLIDNFKRADGLNGFTHDFHQLEAMYNVLREEMKNSPSEKVKDALVLNLLVRIDLLNQQLHKLEREYNKDEKNVDAPRRSA